jgi:hypothetical protein
MAVVAATLGQAALPVLVVVDQAHVLSSPKTLQRAY